MKKLRTWLRFAIHGPAMVNRIWRRLEEMEKSTRERIAELNRSVEAARQQIAEMQVARYEPPKTPEPQKVVVKCQTMKQFHDILDRERELQGDPL